MDALTALAGVAGAIISGGIAAVVNAKVTARAAGKTEGIIQQAIAGLRERVDKVEQTDREQWRVINDHTEDIGILKGRLLNGKAHGSTSH